MNIFLFLFIDVKCLPFGAITKNASMNILSHIFGKCMFMWSTRVELLVTENLFCMVWGRDQDCFPCGYTIDIASLMKSSGLSQCASGLKSKAIIVRVCITVFFLLFLMQICYFSFS